MLGALTAATNSLIAFALIGLCGFALALFVPTFTLFLIWLCFFPFVSTLQISLGARVPDISLDRVVFLVLLINLSINARKGIFSFRKMKLEDILLALFLAWVVFSTVFINRIDLAQQLVAFWRQFLFPIGMFWIIKKIVTNKTKFEKVLTACLLLLVVLAGPAIPEYFFRVTPLGQPAHVVDGAIRVRTFFSSSWEFGDTIVMLFLISLYPWVTRSHANLKKFSIIAFILGSTGILLSFMRGAWLSAAGVLFLLLLFYPKFRKYLYRGMLVLILFAALVMPAVMDSTVWQMRIADLRNIDLRVTALKLQIDLIAQKPIIGHGLDSNFERYVVRTDYYDWGYHEVTLPSHNTFLSMAVDFGFFALLYYLPIAIILFKSILFARKFRKNQFLSGILLLLGLSVLAHLVNSATFETRFFIWLNTLSWVLLALMSIAPRIYVHSLKLSSADGEK